MASTTTASASPIPASIESIQLELRAEAKAIEELRRQIQALGATAPKSDVAEFAKRQKAYLDRKIEFEKQRKTVVDLPTPSLVPPQAKAAEVTDTLTAPPAEKPAIANVAPEEPATLKLEAPTPAAPVVQVPASELPKVQDTPAPQTTELAPEPPPLKTIPLKPAPAKPEPQVTVVKKPEPEKPAKARPAEKPAAPITKPAPKPPKPPVSPARQPAAEEETSDVRWGLFAFSTTVTLALIIWLCWWIFG